MGLGDNLGEIFTRYRILFLKMKVLQLLLVKMTGET